MINSNKYVEGACVMVLGLWISFLNRKPRKVFKEKVAFERQSPAPVFPRLVCELPSLRHLLVHPRCSCHHVTSPC